MPLRSIRLSLPALLLCTCAMTAFAQADSKDLYLDKCAVCHGPDGAGKTAKGRKLNMKGVKETAAKVNEAEMIKIVQNGKGADMSPYGKELSAEQIKGVVAYYRSLAK
ncbi:MAG: cytochrome c [Acidobacteriota bacterium]